MSTTPLTLDELAEKFKAKFPQYAAIPNEKVAQAVLAKYPQYKSRISGAGLQPPKVEPTSTRPTDFSSRVIDRLGENVEGMAQVPGSIMEESRRRYVARHPEDVGRSFMERLKALPGNAADVLRSVEEGTYEKGVAPAAAGLYGVTPPGIAQRVAANEDPAKFAGDALMFYAPGGDEAARGTYSAVDRTKAGPLYGAMTRAKMGMDRLDPIAKDIPVDHAAAYKWAKQAEALQKYGYTVPAPIKAFIEMVESRMRGGKDPLEGRPGEFVDRGGTTQPLTYQDARNFESSLGARIEWDDPGGKMNALQKKMREALGNDTAEALKPYGLDIPYKRAKADFTKAYGADNKWGPFGYFGGKLAGYGAGTFTGHPLMMGYAGGKLGQSAAGSLVRSITEAGSRAAEDPRDVGRGSPVSPVERLRMATDQVNSLKMRVAREPGNYNLVSQLQKAEGDLDTIQKATLPEGYKSSTQTLSRQGGGGANYTAEQLADLKKRMGIK